MTKSQFSEKAFLSNKNEMTLLEVAQFVSEAFGSEAGALWMKNVLNDGATDLLRKASFASKFVFNETPEGFEYWSAKYTAIEKAAANYNAEEFVA